MAFYYLSFVIKAFITYNIQLFIHVINNWLTCYHFNTMMSASEMYVVRARNEFPYAEMMTFLLSNNLEMVF